MGKVFTITEGLENMGALRTGGQGSVYKARRIGPVITAVKLLPTPIHTESADDKNFRNFQNEVEKLKKVNEEPNPNVVKILNSGITESGSFPFIEMEYIEGPDLEELLKPPHESIFTIKETIKLADQLANALSHCHKVSVKHGDIKSNNVKFNIHSGNYVLLDFGLAVMSEEQRRTSLRHAGAIEFMAPEQNEGQMLFQTDVYSYGVILYELLAGQVPFPLKDNGETARNLVMVSHMETPVPDLMELRRKNLPESWSKEKQEREMQVPEWLLNIISKCLEKSPQQRFSNGMQLQDAILNSSIAAVRNNDVNAVEDASVLKSENERLQASLLNYQKEEKVPVVKISRPVFNGLVVLFFLMIAIAAYSLFTNNTSHLPSTVIKDTTASTPATPINKPHQKVSKKVKKEPLIIPADTTNDTSLQKDTSADSISNEILNKQKNMLNKRHKSKKSRPEDIVF